jgi:hypothetical protein
VPVIETVQAESDIEPDWVHELSLATERVMVVAGTLKEDRELMRGARRLLADMDGLSLGLTRRIFEAVAGVLVIEAAEQQRQARSGRGTKSER